MSRQGTPQIKTIVGRNLRAARDAKHLTQREVAQAIGTEGFQVSRWEMGRVRPSDGTLIRLAEALDVPDWTWFFVDHDCEPNGIAA